MKFLLCFWEYELAAERDWPVIPRAGETVRFLGDYIEEQTVTDVTWLACGCPPRVYFEPKLGEIPQADCDLNGLVEIQDCPHRGVTQ